MARHISAYSPLADRMIAEDRVRGRRLAKLEARKRLKQRLAFSIGPTLLIAMGATVIASAQSSSPFANQKKVNAWELQQEGQQQETASPAPRQAASQDTAPRLQLRTRSLDPESATAPPPGATVKKPAAQTATRSAEATRPLSAPTAPAQKSTSTTTSTQTQSSTTTSVTSQTTRSASAPSVSSSTTASTSSESRYSSPLTAPPLNQPTYSASTGTTQSVPSEGYTYQPPAPASNYASSSGLAGSYGSGNYGSGNYGSVPKSSVNNPPSSVNNSTDYTLHQVPPYYAPGQIPRGQQYNPQYEQWAQSNNPTAYDYGYARPGETPPQGQTGGGYGEPPANGPFSKPYPGDAPYPEGPYGYDQPYGSSPYDPPRRTGFFNRLGLGGIATLIRGAVRAGVGARETNGQWEEAFIGDADLDIELSTVTRSGVEWGVHGQVRAQYDKGRKGFVRRLPDCPPTLAGCASIAVPGSPTPAAVRGHTSQFYTFGPDVAKDEEFALESAHIFMRSAYGDVTLGRDDGAAYLFSLGAPSLLNVGASNSPVDYTGLDAVKTVNDASGFSEKVTYTSPRLLGDQVGIGVQLGLSYAPDARGCGVDYCVDLNDIPNVVAPDIQDILEAGLALDRTFAPGVSVEATATYAMGQEQSGLAGLDDLQAYNAGLEFKLNDFTLGGSWLKSNQGVMNGDYDAYDVGLTWKPSRLGFTLGYGHAEDELVGLESDQFVGGVSWDFNEQARISLGGQYADRETLRDVGGVAQAASENATSVFIEGAFRF